jgi:UvrD-like helicase C-terminal domain
VFNGSVGVVTALSLEDQELRVRLDEDEEVAYGFDELDELTHAYAVSIHRSQGSEYPCVVVPFTITSEGKKKPAKADGATGSGGPGESHDASLAARVCSQQMQQRLLGSQAAGSGGGRRGYLVRMAPQEEVTALLAGMKLSRTSALLLTSRVRTTISESRARATPPEVRLMAAWRA